MGIDRYAAGQATGLDPFLARTRLSPEIDALRRQVREATLASSPWHTGAAVHADQHA